MKNTKLIKFLIWFGIIIGIIIVISGIVWFSTSTWRIQKSKTFQIQAEKFYKKSETDEAVTALNKSVFLNPKNYRSWYKLGLIHRAYNEYNDAKYCFLRAYQTKNQDKYLLNYVESALKIEKYGEIEKNLNNSKKSDLKYILTWLQETKKNEKSTDSNLRKISNQNQKKYFLVLNALINQKFEEFDKISPEIKNETTEIQNPDFVNWQIFPDSQVLEILKNLDSKIKNTQIQHSKQLFVYQCMNELGFSTLVTGSMEKLTKKYPEYRDAWVVLGNNYYLEVDYQKALKTLQIAEKLDQSNLPTLKLLAVTYDVLGQKDLADEYREKIQQF